MKVSILEGFNDSESSKPSLVHHGLSRILCRPSIVINPLLFRALFLYFCGCLAAEVFPLRFRFTRRTAVVKFTLEIGFDCCDEGTGCWFFLRRLRFRLCCREAFSSAMLKLSRWVNFC